MQKSSKTDELLETLIGEIRLLKETLTKKVELPTSLEDFPKEMKKSETAPSYPIPQEYRDLVDKTLNKSFGVRITPRADAPLFEFLIIVPDKYSNMSISQREIAKEDVRIKVINMADGVNGVKEWCEKVYKNFNPEIQSMIVADRLNG